MNISKFNSLKIILFTLTAVVFVNVISRYLYTRFDLTQDHRYTLSQTTKKTILSIVKPLHIDVLLQDDLPPNFEKLKKETKLLLEEFEELNDLFSFNFVNPLDNVSDINTSISNLMKIGIYPTSITISKGSNIDQKIIYPWAMISYKKRNVKVNLLKQQLGISKDQQIVLSIESLEYSLSTSILKILKQQRKKIAILKGNGEFSDIYIADFLKSLKDSYRIAPFTLDSINTQPQKILDDLVKYDAAIVAKPTEPFSNKEKYILDQYVMHGGKLLLAIDQAHANLDSLMTQDPYFATPRELELEDLLFKYGLRLNSDLVKDIDFTEIVLATGSGTAAKYESVPWQYAPLVTPTKTHPINNGVHQLKFDFASSIDTLSNQLKKTVLLSSSQHSKLMTLPRQIRFAFVHQDTDKATYNKKNIPLAVLVEGKFVSAYKNRIKPVKINNHFDRGREQNNIIVISDGDIIKNQISKNKPLELGYDKWTNTYYDHKTFLSNCINYLLGDDEFINLRAKKIYTPLLDKNKIYHERLYWQTLSILIPILIISVLALAIYFYQKYKYTKNI